MGSGPGLGWRRSPEINGPLSPEVRGGWGKRSPPGSVAGAWPKADWDRRERLPYDTDRADAAPSHSATSGPARSEDGGDPRGDNKYARRASDAQPYGARSRSRERSFQPASTARRFSRSPPPLPRNRSRSPVRARLPSGPGGQQGWQRDQGWASRGRGVAGGYRGRSSGRTPQGSGPAGGDSRWNGTAIGYGNAVGISDRDREFERDHEDVEPRITSASWSERDGAE